MSLALKIVLIPVAAVGAWYALTPPQPPPRAQERVKSGGVERSFGTVVRIHALIWKVCPVSLLSSMNAPVPSLAMVRKLITLPSAVLRSLEPSRRVRRLFNRHIATIVTVIVIIAAPLFPSPHIDDDDITTTTSTHNDTTLGVRAWMSDDGGERRATPGVLQDAGLAFHFRAHPALGPPARDVRTLFIRAASELQRRRARRHRHAPRALWPRLVVGTSGVAKHAGGAGVRHVLVCHGVVRPL